MRNFAGFEHLIEPDYAKRTDHRFHALGMRMDPAWFELGRQSRRDHARATSKQPWWSMTDMAWVVCLCDAEIIDGATASKLLNGLKKIMDEDSGVSGEERLAPVLGGDMDMASIVNYGRTLQEPMLRLMLRDMMIDVFGDVLEIMETVYRLAMDNVDTIMPGHTHMNQAQPITLAHYLLSVYDGLERGLELFEVAYKHANRNTGGCGSCSGTIWPVDRWLLTRLLGFDDLVEPTYDCESAQDHSLSALFALTNICVLLSRVAMDMSIWGMDEIDMVRVNPKWAGVSSFMPQKCDSSANCERTRLQASDMIGEMFKCVTHLKGEPHGDTQAPFQLPQRATVGMAHARECIGWMNAFLENVFPQKERMLRIVRAGYSCTTELAAHLVKQGIYGNRKAHSVVATMVRDARVAGLKSHECTGEMLDDAAEYLGLKPPGLETATVRRLLDPEEFIKSHVHTGGTAPEETRRLLGIRNGALENAKARHETRKGRIADGEKLLQSRITEICARRETT